MVAACGRLKVAPVKDVAEFSIGGGPNPADVGIVLVVRPVSARDLVPLEAPLIESIEGEGDMPTLPWVNARRGRED